MLTTMTLRSLMRLLLCVFTLLSGVAYAANSVEAAPQSSRIGIVLMHGKGGSPTGYVASLASALIDRGYLVANLDMPWSGNRHYDVDTTTAVNEVNVAIKALKERGANKVFVAGHSQGGAFALYFAGVGKADGVICIAPGGDVGRGPIVGSINSALAEARELIAAGKGNEPAALADYEGSRGKFTVLSKPLVYVSWFDQNSAMNMSNAAANVQADMPILWLVASNDYPNLRKANIPLFGTLAKHPLSHMAEPTSDHKGAPLASLPLIESWIKAVVVTKAGM